MNGPEKEARQEFKTPPAGTAFADHANPGAPKSAIIPHITKANAIRPGGSNELNQNNQAVQFCTGEFLRGRSGEKFQPLVNTAL
jgi:hypothetical protein